MSKTKIITICQNKGGVGKTTVTINLGYLFSEKKKVLFIDTDSQGNLSQFFNAYYNEESKLSNFLEGKGQPLKISKNIDIISNDDNFSIWKDKIKTVSINSHYYLRRELDKIKNDYDFIFIDTPPAFDLSLEMSVLASDYILLVSEPSSFSLQGLETMITKFNRLINDDITGLCKAKFLGIIINQIEKTNFNKQIIEYLKSTYSTFNQTIRKATAIKESQALRKSILEYDKKSNVSEDFKELYKEISKVIK